MRKLLFAVLAFFAVNAGAAIVGPIPNNLTNGTTIDAVPVMANYNWIMNQVNTNAAPLASPTFTGTVTGGAGGFVGALTGSITGNAATVTTNANLTGPVTSVGNATTVAAAQPSITSVGTLTSLTVSGATSTGSQSIGSNLIISATAPTIASGFGTSPSILANNTAAFRVTVGSGGTDYQGQLTMPAAPNDWACTAQEVGVVYSAIRKMNTSPINVQFNNYNSSTGANMPWVAGALILVQCTAY